MLLEKLGNLGSTNGKKEEKLARILDWEFLDTEKCQKALGQIVERMSSVNKRPETAV